MKYILLCLMVVSMASEAVEFMYTEQSDDPFKVSFRNTTASYDRSWSLNHGDATKEDHYKANTLTLLGRYRTSQGFVELGTTSTEVDAQDNYHSNTVRVGHIAQLEDGIGVMFSVGGELFNDVGMRDALGVRLAASRSTDILGAEISVVYGQFLESDIEEAGDVRGMQLTGKFQPMALLSLYGFASFSSSYMNEHKVVELEDNRESTTFGMVMGLDVQRNLDLALTWSQTQTQFEYQDLSDDAHGEDLGTDHGRMDLDSTDLVLSVDVLF